MSALSIFEQGHIAHAKGMYNNDFHLAWGDLPIDYPYPWSVSDTPPEACSNIKVESVTRSDGSFDYLKETVVLEVYRVYQGSNTYNLGIDFQINGNTIDWSLSGAEPAAGTIYNVDYRYRTDKITSLLNEVGRKAADSKWYVVPAKEGEQGYITTDDGLQWNLNPGNEPTRHIFLQFNFNEGEAVGKTIYQTGIYVGTVKRAGIADGVTYLTPDMIEDKGLLHSGANISPIAISAGLRNSFSIVITF